MKNWLILIAWCLLIFSLSAQPAVQVSQTFTLDYAVHKLAHILVYAALQYFSLRAFTFSSSLSRPLFWATLFSLLFAASDELHQSFIPTRTARLSDVGFDLVGIMLINLLVYKLKWLPLSLPTLRRPDR